jgi:hypothetical protein
MSVMKKIRVFLDGLSSGIIFSTQGLIHLGSRSAVDTALSRLNQEGIIQRLAWGIYLNTPDKKKICIDFIQTALFKAQAFGRKILPHGEVIADLLKFPVEKRETVAAEGNDSESNLQEFSFDTVGGGSECELVMGNTSEAHVEIKVVKFFTSGSAADFKILGTNKRVEFVPISPKKFRNYLLEGGYWINAVRTMGLEYYRAHKTELKRKLPPYRSALQSLKESFELMPGWLYSRLNTKYAQRFDLRKHPLIELPELIAPLPKEHLELLWGPAFDWRARL